MIDLTAEQYSQQNQPYRYNVTLVITVTSTQVDKVRSIIARQGELLKQGVAIGLHYALFLRADMGQRWMLIAKLSVTDYFDRDHISSGLQQIDRSSKADLEFQLRLKL